MDANFGLPGSNMMRLTVENRVKRGTVETALLNSVERTWTYSSVKISRVKSVSKMI